MRLSAKRARAVVATVAGLCLAPAAAVAAAPGDAVFTGSTSEGVKVRLTVADAGNATKFKLGKTKVECKRGGTLDNNSIVYRRLDTSDPGSFADRRKAVSDSGGFHFKTRSKVTGEADAAGTTWDGSLKLSTKVFKRGDRIDVCRLKTSWSAS